MNHVFLLYVYTAIKHCCKGSSSGLICEQVNCEHPLCLCRKKTVAGILRRLKTGRYQRHWSETVTRSSPAQSAVVRCLYLRINLSL